jgi:hypothetical protein
MKKLPNAIKWLIVVAVLAALAALMLAVNDRASRVKMPEPDTTFGIYHSPSASTAASALENG